MENRDIAGTIGIIVIVVLLFGFMGGGMMGFGGMGPWMMGGYFGQGYGLGGSILSLLFWVLILGGGALLVVWFGRQSSPSSSSRTGSEETALEILKRRFALGEITREQFEQMRRDLE